MCFYSSLPLVLISLCFYTTSLLNRWPLAPDNGTSLVLAGWWWFNHPLILWQIVAENTRSGHSCWPDCEKSMRVFFFTDSFESFLILMCDIHVSVILSLITNPHPDLLWSSHLSKRKKQKKEKKQKRKNNNNKASSFSTCKINTTPKNEWFSIKNTPVRQASICETWSQFSPGGQDTVQKLGTACPGDTETAIPLPGGYWLKMCS